MKLTPDLNSLWGKEIKGIYSYESDAEIIEDKDVYVILFADNTILEINGIIGMNIIEPNSPDDGTQLLMNSLKDDMQRRKVIRLVKK